MIDLVFPESAKKYMNLQCNSKIEEYTEAKDVEVALDYFCDMYLLQNINRLKTSKPMNFLDIGSGIGRASMYMAKMLERMGIPCPNMYLLDGGVGDKQIAGVNNTETGDTFYNNWDATLDFWNANSPDTNLRFVTGPSSETAKQLENDDVKFDFVYSVRAIGFHWPCTGYMQALSEFIKPGALAFFEMRRLLGTAYTDRGRWVKYQNFVQQQIREVTDSKKYRFVEFKETQQRAFCLFRKI